MTDAQRWGHGLPPGQEFCRACNRATDFRRGACAVCWAELVAELVSSCPVLARHLANRLRRRRWHLFRIHEQHPELRERAAELNQRDRDR